MGIPIGIWIPFRNRLGAVPYRDLLSAFYKGNLMDIDGLKYLEDYSGNEYHALAKDSIIYLNGSDNYIDYGDVTVGDDWTVALSFIIPNSLNDLNKYTLFESDDVFIGHKSGDGNGIRFSVTIDETEYVVDGSGCEIDDNEKHVVSASFRRNNQISLYVDGAIIGTTLIYPSGDVSVQIENSTVGGSSVDGFIEILLSKVDIIDQYLNIEEASDYFYCEYGVSETVYEVYEGIYGIDENGYEIIETI